MTQLIFQQKMLTQLAKFAKVAITPLAIAFLGYLASQEIGAIENLVRTANTKFLLLSVLLWITGQLLLPIFTMTIFSAWNHPASYGKLLIIHSTRLPAKYVPGGVWHAVARSVDYLNIGISKRQMMTYLLLENLMAACVTLATGGLIILSDAVSIDWILATIATIVVISIIALMFGPRMLTAGIAGKGVALAPGDYLKGLISIWLFWTVAASSFVIFVLAFDGLHINDTPLQVGGIYMFSWGIGFISVFSPQGLGVFELVASMLINAPVSLAYLTTLFAGFRLIVLVADISTWGLVTLSTIRSLKKPIIR